MNKLMASTTLAFFFLATPPTHAWSLKEAHQQANTTLVQVGDWCSGTIIDKDKGLIVTAAHCTEKAKVTKAFEIERPNGEIKRIFRTSFEPIAVTVWNFDDQGNTTGYQVYSTKVLKAVYPFDVAILQSLSPAKLSGAVKINATPVSYGDKVYTVGNPLMLLGAVGEGNVEKPKYTLITSDGQVEVIAFSAFITHGSSGGGLFNDAGELVGITDWGIDGGPYLASPVQNVLDLLRDLKLDVMS